MPGHADKERAIVAIVGRPPRLRVGHQRMQITDDRMQVEGREGLGVVEVRFHRVRLVGMLMKNPEVELIRPPVGVRTATGHRRGCGGPVHRTFRVSRHAVRSSRKNSEQYRAIVYRPSPPSVTSADTSRESVAVRIPSHRHVRARVRISAGPSARRGRASLMSARGQGRVRRTPRVGRTAPHVRARARTRASSASTAGAASPARQTAEMAILARGRCL